MQGKLRLRGRKFRLELQIEKTYVVICIVSYYSVLSNKQGWLTDQGLLFTSGGRMLSPILMSSAHSRSAPCYQGRDPAEAGKLPPEQRQPHCDSVDRVLGQTVCRRQIWFWRKCQNYILVKLFGFLCSWRFDLFNELIVTECLKQVDWIKRLVSCWPIVCKLFSTSNTYKPVTRTDLSLFHVSVISQSCCIFAPFWYNYSVFSVTNVKQWKVEADVFGSHHRSSTFVFKRLVRQIPPQRFRWSRTSARPTRSRRKMCRTLISTAYLLGGELERALAFK